MIGPPGESGSPGRHRVTELVGQGRQQERDRDDRSRDPRARTGEPADMSATWVAVVTPMTARMMAHDTWMRTSKPRMRATGSAFIATPRGRPTTPRRGRAASADAEALAASIASARTVATAADHGGEHDADGADGDRGLLPELEREELDEPFRGGSKV